MLDQHQAGLFETKYLILESIADLGAPRDVVVKQQTDLLADLVPDDLISLAESARTREFLRGVIEVARVQASAADEIGLSSEHTAYKRAQFAGRKALTQLGK